MHEVAAIQGVIETILTHMQQAKASRVIEVQLVIGASGHFTEEAARLHFTTLSKGTPVEDADLTITWLPASFLCLSCTHRFESYESEQRVRCPRCEELALEIGHKDVCFVSAIDVTGSKGEHTASPLEASPNGAHHD